MHIRFDASPANTFQNILIKDNLQDKRGTLLLPQCFHLYSIIILLLWMLIKSSVADKLYVGKGSMLSVSVNYERYFRISIDDHVYAYTKPWTRWVDCTEQYQHMHNNILTVRYELN